MSMRRRKFYDTHLKSNIFVRNDNVSLRRFSL